MSPQERERTRAPWRLQRSLKALQKQVSAMGTHTEGAINPPPPNFHYENLIYMRSN